MELRYKILLLAVAPLVVAAGLLTLVVHRQGRALAEGQVVEVEKIVVAAKEEELRHLMALARGAIRDLESSRALDKLRGLDYGEDGYFFVYDLQGQSLMHPRLGELVGQNLWNLTDERGQPVIQRLIAKARAGGGFVEYQWQRPSRQRPSQKLGYVVQLPQWGWMLGTGIYLEDVEAITRRIRAQSSAAIGSTMFLIAAIALLLTTVVAAAGVALNLSQQRLADAKLRELAWQVVAAQEEERARVSDDLHDSVGENLVAARFLLETALAELRSQPARAADTLVEGVTELIKGMDMVRRLSHDLHPLQGRPLQTAVEEIAAATSERTGLVVVVEAAVDDQPPSERAATALFRVAQEALRNVERHARARRVSVRLSSNPRGTSLTVSDDGCGFDVNEMEGRTRRGIGLSKMRGRIEALGGRLSIRSTAQGTEIDAFLPGEVARSDGHDNRP
jgi:two-component system NarL family sensor kinase